MLYFWELNNMRVKVQVVLIKGVRMLHVWFSASSPWLKHVQWRRRCFLLYAHEKIWSIIVKQGLCRISTPNLSKS